MPIKMVTYRNLMVVLLLSAGSLLKAQTGPSTDIRYCTRSHESDWQANAFQPLIDRSAHQTLAKATYTGGQLSSLRLRKFTADYEIDFEYRFDAGEHLRGLYGEVIRWGQWVYESESFREVSGRFVPAESKYARVEGGLSIAEPTDGRQFAKFLAMAPTLDEVSDIPCVANLRQRQPYLAMAHLAADQN